MDRAQLEAVGLLLAKRHVVAVDDRPEHSLLDYAERPRAGDWSLRSALVRLAQPEPHRAAEVLTLVRRLDAALGSFTRSLERRFVTCDRELGESPGIDAAAPYPDIRTADLARVVRAQPDGLAVVVDSYGSVWELDADERAALPLLAVALDLDELADELARWAERGSNEPPITSVDTTRARVGSRLDDLDVPVEEAPPGRGRR